MFDEIIISNKFTVCIIDIFYRFNYQDTCFISKFILIYFCSYPFFRFIKCFVSPRDHYCGEREMEDVDSKR